MRSLSDLQKDILKLIASSPKLLVTNRIATMLGKDQTTIYNSVESLIERGMLEPERQKNGIRKYLKLTERGLFDILSEILPEEMDKQSIFNTVKTLALNHSEISPIMFGIVNLQIEGARYLVFHFVNDDHFHLQSYDTRLRDVQIQNEILHDEGTKSHDIGVIDFMFLSYLISEEGSDDFSRIVKALRDSPNGRDILNVLSAHINFIVGGEIDDFRNMLEKGLLLFPAEKFRDNLTKIIAILNEWLEKPPVYQEPDPSKIEENWGLGPSEQIDEEEEGANP